jgi:hypothetical protein
MAAEAQKRIAVSALSSAIGARFRLASSALAQLLTGAKQEQK